MIRVLTFAVATYGIAVGGLTVIAAGLAVYHWALHVIAYEHGLDDMHDVYGGDDDFARHCDVSLAIDPRDEPTPLYDAVTRDLTRAAFDRIVADNYAQGVGE